MSDLTVITEALGGSALTQAALARELGEWYRLPPTDRTGWRSHAADVVKSVPHSWLDALRPALSPTGAARERLEAAVTGKGVVITTGQQPGLFGGPLMTLLKALSARAVADALEAELSVPVAPVFWAATDDADFAEASVTTVVHKGVAEVLQLAPTAPAGTPMSHVPIDAAVGDLFARLSEASGSAADRQILELAARAYKAGNTVGGAYVELLRALLEPLGIAVLDAAHPAVAEAAAPLLVRAAAEARGVADAVHQRTQEIETAGFRPQVEEVAGLSLVFVNENGIKRRLPIDEAMARRGASTAKGLSPTVLLRPVLERAILPTAAYIGGPGEVAYFAQLGAVAESLGAAVPVVLPRWSCTIVEPRIQELLAQLGLEPADLRDPHAAEQRLALQHMPPSLAKALADLRTHLDGDVKSLSTASDGIVPAAVIEGLKHNLLHRVERADRRLTAGVKRRETETMHRVSTVRAALYPNGVRQERKLSYIPFLARHGTALIETLSSHADQHAQRVVLNAESLDKPSKSLTGAR